MATKEELLHEIDIVTTFSSKYNMKDQAQTARYIKFFNEKKVFKTQIGVQYLERLNQIKDGKVEELCFICKKNPSYDGVLCDDCMSKYTRGKKSFFGRDDFEDLNAMFVEDAKAETPAPTSASAPKATEQIKVAADVAKAKVSDISDKVQSRLQEDDVQKAKAEISAKMSAAGEKAKKFAKDNDLEGKAEVAKEKAKGAGGKFMNWWKARKKWQKIAIIAVVAVILLGAVFGNSGGVFQDDADKYISDVQNEFIDYMQKASGQSDIPVEIKLYSGSEQGSEGSYIYNLYFSGQNNATIGIKYENGKRKSVLVSSGMGVDSFLITSIAAMKAADKNLSTDDALDIADKVQEIFNNYMDTGSGDTDYKKGKYTYMYYYDIDERLHNLAIAY